MTASESGETGRIEGKIGIGAAFEGTPFVHVARLLALGRTLGAVASGGIECAGEAQGESGRVVVCWGTAGAVSRATNDLRNHDEVFYASLGEASGESFPDKSDCFRPRSRDEDDFKRSGSNASWKYSCARASVEVGLFRGSHIKHDVTNLAKLAGHCGACRIVSIECGAICRQC